MYELRINTSQYESKKRKLWEHQLYNDTCVKLDGLSWKYVSKARLKNRFDALRGYSSSINIHAESNYITLKDESYGEQRVRKGLPGICTGYVSWEKVEQQLEKTGFVRIPFTSFYDTRALNKSLGLDKCFIEISKVES